MTGHLLNWTLSDAANRVTVVVGVAYESDADQVTRVLREIVAAEPLVLEDPRARGHVRGVRRQRPEVLHPHIRGGGQERLPAIHALHSAIARRFRDEHIDIAFPRRRD